ncbi:hypothetical protein OLMES_4319 [Oleiphilus messinensis]|uniref:Uncharacterized protein n=1 Tax=Oleiphilus messinensis TaxID=141451 RepID=A0A1Y0ICT1_9GAMM|nr:hypothetical protein [Oleiphilus messinensis]ARU58327.1 hypothetical protein OLMES_4319 [Oleiphilus messinensis]
MQELTMRTLVFRRLLRLLFLVPYGVLIFLIPQFKDLFNGFGTDLPVATEILLKNYYYLPIFYVFHEIMFYWVPGGNRENFKKVFKYNIALAFLIFLVAIVILYIPTLTGPIM